MAVLEGLEPRGVLHWFEELCRIPHGSGNTQALSDYLVQFGRDRGLEVQQDALVTNLDEFAWYLDHLELYGGGGTDFRPAFRRIDELVSSGEFARLGGVLYFTDGYGVFPETAPDYPVAFVMLQYRYDDINIPRWAGKLILDAEKPGRDEGWI